MGCTTKPASSCPRGTNPGRTYKFYTGKPVMPFGFGLSYTTFNYAAEASSDTASLERVHALLTRAQGRSSPSLKELGAETPLVKYRVNVTNTGNVDSDDVVLGFLSPPGAGTN